MMTGGFISLIHASVTISDESCTDVECTINEEICNVWAKNHESQRMPDFGVYKLRWMRPPSVSRLSYLDQTEMKQSYF